MHRTAFIYCRISDDKTGAKLGVQRQEEDCRALAAEKGYQIVRVFQDNDISAYSGKARPEYTATLRVRLERYQGLIASPPNRVGREPGIQ
jgi:site-specific DNA recombinase